MPSVRTIIDVYRALGKDATLDRIASALGVSPYAIRDVLDQHNIELPFTSLGEEMPCGWN